MNRESLVVTINLCTGNVELADRAPPLGIVSPQDAATHNNPAGTNGRQIDTSRKAVHDHCYPVKAARGANGRTSRRNGPETSTSNS